MTDKTVVGQSAAPPRLEKLDFSFSRRDAAEIYRTSSFSEAFNLSSPKDERFLFITAHDDDPVLGSALFIRAARQEDIPVHVLITTDGSMGYLLAGHNHHNISAVRRDETYAGYELLGVPPGNIHFLDYPDAHLVPHAGRWEAAPEEAQDKLTIAGFRGLQNSYVHHIRAIRPTRVLIHTANDYHPDHKVVHQEGLWALFVAAGQCWQELGKPLGYRPRMQEYFVYSDFTGDPTWQIKSPDAARLRIEAVRKFASQGDVGGLEQELMQTGPFEWHQELHFQKADRARLRRLFETITADAEQ